MRPQGNGRGVAALVLAQPGSYEAGRLVDAAGHLGSRVEVEAPDTSRELQYLLASRQWDVVLWHPTCSLLSGMHGLRDIRREQPGAVIIAVAGPEDSVVAQRATSMGANAAVIIPSEDAELYAALEAAVNPEADRQHLPPPPPDEDHASNRMDLLLALSEEAIFLATPAGTVIRVNPRAEEIAGRGRGQLVGIPLATLFRPRETIERAVETLLNPSEQPAGEERAEEIAAGLAVSGLECFLRQEHGAFTLVKLSLGAVRSSSGEIADIVAVAAPAGEEQWLESELLRTQHVSDLLAESVSDAVGVVDAAGVLVRANRGMALALGKRKPEECLGRSLAALVGSESVARALGDAIAEGRETEAEGRLSVGAGGGPAPVRVIPVCGAERAGVAALVLIATQAVAPTSSSASPAWHCSAAARRAVQLAVEDAASDLAQVVEPLVEVAAATLGEEGALLVARGADGKVSAAWRGLSDPLGQTMARMLGDKLARVTTGARVKALSIADLRGYLPRADEPELVAGLIGEGWNSCVFQPLVAGDRTLGMLMVAGRRRLDEPLAGEELHHLAAHVTTLLCLVSEHSLAERQRKLLEDYAKLCVELATATELPVILDIAANSARGMLHGDWAAIHLLAAQADELEAAVRVDADGNVRRGVGVPAEAYRVAWESLEVPEPLARSLEAGGGEMTVVAARLRSNGEVAGSIVVGWDGVAAVDECDSHMLELMARRVALAIRCSRVYEQEEARSSQFRALASEAMEVEARVRSLLWAASAAAELRDINRILWTLTDAGLRAVNVEEMRIYLADHEEGVLRGATIGRAPDVIEPLAETLPLQRLASVRSDAALSDAPYLVTALEAAGKSYEAALIPLRTQTALVGLLEGGNPVSGKELPPQDLRMLRMLASLAAVAIDRARMDALREGMERSVSHELRTPLSSIRAYTELLLDEGAGPVSDEQRLFLERVATACEYLETLVEDLLDLSRLRAGEVRLRPTVVEMGDLIEEVLDRLHGRIVETGAEVEVEVADGLDQVISDPTRLSQVITNLVDNAVKFSEQPGKVRIRAKVEEGEVVLSVRDNGPGIPPGELDSIFREFYRGRNEHAQLRPGVGLGLPIARRVARLLGGDLTVDSEVGQGSTFWFRFPYKPPDAPVEGHEADAGMSGSGLAEWA